MHWLNTMPHWKSIQIFRSPMLAEHKHFSSRGGAREAFSPLRVALRVSPKDPFAFVWHFNLCHTHLHLHEYKEAIEECRLSINLNNSFLYPYIDLISAYGA